MSSTIILNVAIWKWNGEAGFPINGSQLGSVIPNCFICLHNGFITRISSTADQIPSLKDFDNVIDGKGRLVLPGLIDSHIHLGLLGESQYFVDLSKCCSMQELRETIQIHIGKYPDLSWIIGVNWDQTNLGCYPTRQDIDPISADKPIFLWRACWHIGLANTPALTLASIVGKPYDECEKAPTGGVIEVDSQGIPTGIVKERACELIVAAQQKQSVGGSSAIAQKMRFLSDGMAMCAKVGLTSVQTNDEGALKAYQTLQSQNALPLRIFLTPLQDELYHTPTDTRGIKGISPFRPACLANVDMQIIGPDGKGAVAYHDASNMHSRLLMERVKIFSDGSLGAETAALRVFPKPSASSGADSASVSTSCDASAGFKSNENGVLVHEKSALTSMLADAYCAGYRVEVHAIGDAAAEFVLSALEASEALIQGSSVPDHFDTLVPVCAQRHWRPLLTHCQVLGADLIERMAALGVVANVQPPFVPTDMKWVRARLGDQQLRYSYAWKTLLMHSSLTNSATSSSACTTPSSPILVVAGGSDSPIEHPNPFTGMYDAIFRTNKHRLKSTASAEEEIVFQPDECLSFSQALWIYTIGGAYAGAVERKLGHVAEGFVGDLVLVDPDIVTQPELLHNLLPDAVLVGGVLSAANNLLRGNRDGCATDENGSTAPVLLKGVGPVLWAVADRAGASVSLSEATFLPGRNGRPSNNRRNNQPVPPPFCVSEYCVPSDGMVTSGLRCACILRGKYCSEV